MKGGEYFLASFIILAWAFSSARVYDPSPLQDFCVAIDEPKNAVFVNGKFCKNPNETVAEDFFYSGLNIPGDTENPNGLNVILLNVDKIPILNTLGIALARLDYAPNGGLNLPHTHPRGIEILVVIQGILYVGFVTSSATYRLISKVLQPGDVFVFLIGLIHFQFNLAKTNVIACAALSSQNAGLITIADSVFRSDQPINPEVLAKAFRLDKNVVLDCQKKFG